MTVNCVSGKTLRLDELQFIKPTLKKSNFFTMENLKESLETDGLIFPISVQKQDDGWYIVDGASRVKAMKELKNEGKEVPEEIPVNIIRGDIKKNNLISASTCHVIHQEKLRKYAEEVGLDLHKYSFFLGTLMDFFVPDDIERVFDERPIKKNDEEYAGLLKEGKI